ncbi:hypothetical protein BDW68DRAFT_163832 [Aspergillus falconensis]
MAGRADSHLHTASTVACSNSDRRVRRRSIPSGWGLELYFHMNRQYISQVFPKVVYQTVCVVAFLVGASETLG